ATIYDEPFADSSQIPTFIVSKMAREYVTVALSGDGGDELFGGYTRYAQCNAYWNIFRKIPSFIKSSGKNGLRFLYGETQGGRAARARKMLAARNALEFYQARIAVWSDAQMLVKIKSGLIIDSTRSVKKMKDLSLIEKFMLLDSQTYLPDDILTKVDRASMATSLEVRVPILDHRIVEFAWTMPMDYKLFAGISKWPLRNILSKHIPENLFDRPKQGFSPPLAMWLRHELREWAGELIFAKYLDDFQLNYKSVRDMWKQHQENTHDRSYYLWPAICLSAWLKKNHTEF
ncbi:MAG: asparagine synthetase B, partial [Candidatus Aenigmarchaeota archaeon]|nr:asparagine synthetase B [Candidatus Aenigmarchaeota archaeon]